MAEQNALLARTPVLSKELNETRVERILFQRSGKAGLPECAHNQRCRRPHR